MRAGFLRLLTGLAALAFLWTIAIWWTGGFTVTLLGLRVASNTPWRPLIVALVATAVVLWRQGPRATIDDMARMSKAVTPLRASIILAIATTGVGLGFNSWTASGPDPFAYVSQAALWRSGHPEVPVPLAAEVPWPNAVATFVPFGYRGAPDGAAALVPMTAAGLPLLMAGLQGLAGHWAAFLVTPVSGGALVLLTFAIGRRAHTPAAGLIAAALVATSPAVLFMLMWPMTDIPAAACTALMVWLLLNASPRSALLAGLTASAGVLIRANFIAMAAGALVWLLIDGRNVRRFVPFALGLIPSLGITLWLNARWYGSPLSTGYGAVGQILSLSHLTTNAVRYARWLAETSPFVLAGFAALAVLVVTQRRVFSLLAIVAVTAWIPYLFYSSFDDWWYLRFLLPAWPAMCLGAAVSLEGIRGRGGLAAIGAAALVVATCVSGVKIATTRGVFAFNERRYATIAHLVDAATEPAAVILTVQHAGPVRYYGGRETVRWDVLDPAWLDRTVAWLSAHGRRPYLLIEDWEMPQFEARFGAANDLGRLSFSPALAWQSNRADGWIFLYDPQRRDAATSHPGPDVERAEPFSSPQAGTAWPR